MRRLGARAAAVLVLASVAATGTGPAAAASLEQVRRNGSLGLCANPVALPFASREPGPAGFQVEIAEALAREMGLGLTVQWVWSRNAARRVSCDVLMDSIVVDDIPAPAGLNLGPRVEREGLPLKLTKAYFASGVALVVPGTSAARTFADLRGQKIGVIPGSLAQRLLQAQGLTTSSFMHQDDIVDAVARGEVAGGAVVPVYVGWYRKQHPQADVRIPEGYAFDPALRWDVAVGLRGADDALVEAVNAALDRLVSTRVVADIYARYGVEYRPPLNGR